MKTLAKNDLTPVERSRYVELKPLILDGINSFVTVGQWLLEVSDNRLYREEYATFADFVQAECNISAPRAYQLCEAAAVIKSLPPESLPLVDNERQARALAKVAPAKRAEVLEKAALAGEVTAKSIREAAQEEEPPKPPSVDDKWKEALGGKVPEEVTYHLELVRADIDVILGKIKEGKFSKDDLGEVIVEFTVAIQKLRAFKKSA